MTEASTLPPVRVSRLELVTVALPLVRPFRTSFGTQQRLEKLLVRIETDDAIGWGECVAPSAPIYSAEYTAGAAQVIEHHLAPRLLADPQVDAAELPARLGAIKGHPMAKAAIEMAVLDAQLRAAGRALADHLGAVHERVPCGVSVGIPEGGVEALVDEVVGYLDAGYLRIKCKIEPGFDREPVNNLRERFGDVPLQVDANAAYPADDLDTFRALDELGLELIEQPYRPELLRAHARLADDIGTPVCLDESIHDAPTATEAIAVGACSVVNIKAGRVGGITEAVRVHDVCAAWSVPVWCGGMLETGLGRAVNVALAALPNMQFPGDTSASDRYFATDLTEPFVLTNGHLEVPRIPGIGREPLPDVLAAVTTERRRIHP